LKIEAKPFPAISAVFYRWMKLDSGSIHVLFLPKICCLRRGCPEVAGAHPGAIHVAGKFN
jgi:hypothetical protein